MRKFILILGLVYLNVFVYAQEKNSLKEIDKLIDDPIPISFWQLGLEGIYYNGNVGIGTSLPSYKLHAAGDIYANGGWVRVSGAKGLYFQSYGGGFYMTDNTWIRTYGNKSFYHNSGTMRTDGTFQVGPNGDRFIVNTSGNTGIGTTNPDFKLQIENSVAGDGGWTSGVNIKSSNLTAGEAAVSYNNISTGTNHWIMGLNQNANFRIAYGSSFTNSYTKMTITTDGKLGIGTTAPSHKLEVNGDIYTHNEVVLKDASGTDHILGDDASGETSGIVLRTSTNPSAGEPIFVVESSGNSQRLRVEHDGAVKTSNILEVDGTGNSYFTGNVGVGTTTPSKKLDVDGDINLTGSLYKNGSLVDLTGSSSIWQDNGTDTYINSGSVGIGTTAPSKTLDVAGDINFTGNLYSNGALVDFTASTSGSTISDPGIVGEDNLVGYWPFNGNANDESTNSNDFNVTGAVLTEDKDGNGSSAYEFNGIDNYLTNTSTVYDQLNTISFWFKPSIDYNSTNSSNIGLINANSMTSEPDGFLIYLYGNVDQQNDDNGRIILEDITEAGNITEIKSINNSWVANTWYHILVVLDGSGKIYVNGEDNTYSSTITNSNLTISSSNVPIYLGFLFRESIMTYYNGALDEVAYFDKVLDEKEIAKISGNYSVTKDGFWTQYLTDLYYEDGNVGLGTDSPTAPLEIKSAEGGIKFTRDAYDTWTIRQAKDIGRGTGGDGYGFGIYNETKQHFYLAFSGAGSTGIGTNSPSATLDIEGPSMGNWLSNNPTLRVRSGSTSGSAISWLESLQDHPTYFVFRSSNKGRIWMSSRSSSENYALKFYTDPSYTGNPDKTVLTIEQNGNVGIGKETPTTKLHIAQDEEGIDKGLSIEGTTSSNSGRIWMANDKLHIDNANVGAQSGLTVSQNGNIGIGIVDPLSKLEVNGDINFSGNLFKNGQQIDFEGIWNRTDNNLYFNTGNIGIGTDSPSQKLVVVGNISLTGNIYQNGVALAAWRSNGVEAYYNDGNIGIGTDSPSKKLDVNGDINFSGVISKNGYELANWRKNGSNTYYKDGNVGIGITNPETDLHILGEVKIQGSWGDLKLKSDGISFTRSLPMFIWNENEAGSLILGTGLGDKTIANSAIYISPQNKVGIGMSAYNIPSDYKLAVDGKIICEEVKVEMSDFWADFVFDDNYQLINLKDLDNYIQKNKHLPEIPTTAEVEENGISVGEMNAKLLQKIEELTLYTIEQQKMIESLLNRVEELENK